jgi:hypothetical protein
LIRNIQEIGKIRHGPGGIRTLDLSNANAVSYQTRRPALCEFQQSGMDINTLARKPIYNYNNLLELLVWGGIRTVYRSSNKISKNMQRK